jgi:nitrogen regulatory protein PII-like uncharacterized protein
MEMRSLNLRQGSYFLSYALPWAQLRELSRRPETPEFALDAINDAMKHQVKVPGIFPHDLQVRAIKELMSFEEIAAERFAVPDGPVRSALTEAYTAMDIARAKLSGEALSIAQARVQASPGVGAQL